MARSIATHNNADTTPYNYQEIVDFRKNKVGWRQIGAFYNRDHTNAYRWFKKEQQLRRKVNKPQTKPKSTTKDINKSIRRLRYGELEPTRYREEIKDLDHVVRWIQTYTPYMQGDWDNAATRKTAKLLFFDVFIRGISKMRGAPRDSGKSKVSVAVYACIAANYWLPQSIIINGAKSKRRIYNGLWKIFRWSTKFREAYGDLIFARSSNEGYLELHPELVIDLYERTGYVTDDPLVQISPYSGIIGSHPYIAYLEDMLQSEFKSEESNEYVLYEIYLAVIRKLTNRIGGTFTRKGKDDVYSEMPTYGVELVVDKAIVCTKGSFPKVTDLILDGGRPVDVKIPEGSEYWIIDRPGWTIKSLLLDRTMALQDKKSFVKWEREMQNNIIVSEGAYFIREQWIVQDQLPMIVIKNQCYVIVDPSFGKSTSSDFFCLYVAVIFRGRMHNVYTELHRGLTLEQQLFVIRHYRDWLNPINSWVEFKFAQVWIEQRAERDLWLSPWDEPGTVRLDKTQRIDGLAVPYARGKIIHSNNMESGIIIPGHRCTPKMCGKSVEDEAFRHYIEYDQRPSDPKKKDDFLDCEATAWSKLKNYVMSNTIVSSDTSDSQIITGRSKSTTRYGDH